MKEEDKERKKERKKDPPKKQYVNFRQKCIWESNEQTNIILLCDGNYIMSLKIDSSPVKSFQYEGRAEPHGASRNHAKTAQNHAKTVRNHTKTNGTVYKLSKCSDIVLCVFPSFFLLFPSPLINIVICFQGGIIFII